jgi:GNAT superfamily N-acetyltransferase
MTEETDAVLQDPAPTDRPEQDGIGRPAPEALARQLMATRAKLRIAADDGRVFKFKYIDRSDRGAGLFTIKVYTGFRAIGFVDVTHTIPEAPEQYHFISTKFRVRGAVALLVKNWNEVYRGIGTALVSLALGVCKRMGSRKVMAYRVNWRVQDFYLKAGFRKVGGEEYLYDLAGRPLPEVDIRKRRII